MTAVTLEVCQIGREFLVLRIYLFFFPVKRVLQMPETRCIALVVTA